LKNSNKVKYRKGKIRNERCIVVSQIKKYEFFGLKKKKIGYSKIIITFVPMKLIKKDIMDCMMCKEIYVKGSIV